MFPWYQRSVEWATKLLQRQGRYQSTVRGILEDYTKPLEHPCTKQSEEVQLYNELNSEMVSNMQGTADRERLSEMNGVVGKSEDLEDPSVPPDHPLRASRHNPLTAGGPAEPTVEVAAPLPPIHCGRQDAPLPQCDTQPEDSSQGSGLICAQEGGPDHEYVLVEEVVSDGEDALDGDAFFLVYALGCLSVYYEKGTAKSLRSKITRESGEEPCAGTPGPALASVPDTLALSFSPLGLVPSVGVLDQLSSYLIVSQHALKVMVTPWNKGYTEDVEKWKDPGDYW
ncbi:hypothetical protein CB1_000465010 [Camelus ferus]|nr:hypothetical protein CB1_000465010 [Camelus ferus]